MKLRQIIYSLPVISFILAPNFCSSCRRKK